MQLGELLKGDFPVIEESIHRTKGPKERPEKEVALMSLAKETKERTKTQCDPTPDLVELPAGGLNVQMTVGEKPVYGVFCLDTLQMWIAPTKKCLDANFIYRDDLVIRELYNTLDVADMYDEFMGEVPAKVLTRKSCYILDLPGNETYEVYYDSAYPSLTYGKATPVGSLVHKYKDRFHRDMAILELDDLYSNSSTKVAGKFTAKEFKQNEAIIISDGAWMKEVSSSACYYLDAESVIHLVEGRLPSEKDQSVLISEVKAAYNALGLCYARGKKRVTYYYDNTSILNIFRNRKTEYIEEVKVYKDLCEKMFSEGFQVNFVEIHPKTGEDRADQNKALMFFHNRCDDYCREMCDLLKKDYRSYAQYGHTDGKTYKQVKEDFKPKGKPGQQRRPQGNRR